MTVLIPAYEPDERLLKLIAELKEQTHFGIVVVNDGSGPRFQSIFEKARRMGCTVLTHETNWGKGCALKTGFAYILKETKETTGVVTADADGQHLAGDIIKVAAAVDRSSGEIVLGVRRFVGRAPFRSIVGNTVTRVVFSIASGERIVDTQTGLRGFSIFMLLWLVDLEGERFEYEMNMLLKAKSAGYRFTQVDIETVYIPGSRSSHFRTINDSMRVCLPFIKFCLSGISSAVIDYVLLFVFQWMTGNLFLSVVGARVASSAVNFTINRTVVFGTAQRKRRKRKELPSYYLLVVVLLLLNYLLLRFLSQDLEINLFLSKLLTEITLFGLSFTVQHLFIFRRPVRSYSKLNK